MPKAKPKSKLVIEQGRKVAALVEKNAGLFNAQPESSIYNFVNYISQNGIQQFGLQQF